MMKNLQEFETILKEKNGMILKTGELNSLGINSYYIKKLVNEGILDNVSRGHYLVNLKIEEKKEESKISHRKANGAMFHFFNEFKKYVFQGKYERAYEALVENYKLQYSHNYDNHMRTYFMLLKELLGNGYDFSMLDELYEFSESNLEEGYYEYFTKFREEVMLENYYDALNYLDKYKREELKHKGTNLISILLFDRLINDVIRKKELKNESIEEKNKKARIAYEKFIVEFRAGNYESALKYLDTSIFNTVNDVIVDRNCRIKKVLYQIIEVSSSKILEPVKINYKNNLNCFTLLNSALDLNDFFKANSVIDECIENNGGKNKSLLLLKEMLDKLMELNNNLVINRSQDSDVNDELVSSNICTVAFSCFENCYENGDLEKALNELNICVNNCKDEEDLKYYKRILNILEKIISMKENNEVFEEMDIDYSEFYYAKDIVNHALDIKDFYTAFKNVGKYTYQTKNKKLLLMKDMLHKLFQISNENERKQKVVKSSSENLENQERTSFNAYVNFEMAFKQGYFEDALKYLKISVENNSNLKYATNNRRLVALLEKIISMQKNREVWGSKGIDYSYLTNPVDILNAAIDNQDYYVAFKNIGKCTYKSNSKILLLIKDMLHHMYQISKENEKYVVKEESSKSEVVNNSVKLISDDELYNYVYDRKYEDLKEILIKEKKVTSNQLTRVKVYTLKLLYDLLDIKKDSYNVWYDKTYVSNEDDYLHRIFEALKFKDYENARYYIGVFFEKNESSLEFSIYDMILEDIIYEMNNKEIIEETKKNVKQLDKKIISYVGFKKELSDEDYQNLYAMINDKINGLVQLNEDYKYDFIALNILNMIESIQNLNITPDYFETFDYTNIPIQDALIKSLENGDYVTSYKIITTYDFKKDFSLIPFNSLIILKKLLFIFNFTINKVISNDNKVALSDEEFSNENILSEKLSKLKKLIKKRDFFGAFYYYVLNDFDNVSENFDEDISSLISILYNEQLNEKKKIFDEYVNLVDQKEYELAKKKLDEYKEFLSMSSLDRNIDYHYKRLEWYTSDNSDVEEKNILYKKSVNLLQEKKKLEALDYIEEYIRLDKGKSARGYLMRGRIKELLGNYDDAIADFKRAISIIPEPNAFQRLAKCYIRKNNYEEALKCLNEFISRRPTKHADIYKELSDVNDILGNTEEAIRLRKIYSTLSKR